ncbi:CLUMA_CG002296, isoform A [Clunio marinus]|uniref:CLUMA_CG002296, isoform A n=1 Tax=Clunio marinus TaxID=568069 RepID=A0A1J1HKV4_9DIPT|nr:CLUMA_CG002296, isoform A [Clunio marinus]
MMCNILNVYQQQPKYQRQQQALLLDEARFPPQVIRSSMLIVKLGVEYCAALHFTRLSQIGCFNLKLLCTFHVFLTFQRFFINVSS